MPRGQDSNLLHRKRKKPEKASAALSDDDSRAELGGSFDSVWGASAPQANKDDGILDLSKHTQREVRAIMSKSVIDAFKRGDDDSCRRHIRALNSLMIAGYFRRRHDWGGEVQ